MIELPKHYDPRGSLTVVEQLKNIPFDIANLEWVYGIDSEKTLTGETSQSGYKLLVALSGSFYVTLTQDESQETIMLNHPYQGLLVKPSTHFLTSDASNGAVYLILSSE